MNNKEEGKIIVEYIVIIIGIVAVILALGFMVTLFANYGRHLDDKAYRLCMNGIVEDTLSSDAKNGCLEKYGVEIKNSR